MRKLAHVLLVAHMLERLFLWGFDYKWSGATESVSKVAFNTSQINSLKGIYPTESFIAITVKTQIDSTLLHKGSHKISSGLGGALGALAYDSTRYLVDQSTGKIYGSKVFYYIGRWWGYLGDAPWRASALQSDRHTRPYVLYSAYLRYEYGRALSITVGRYSSKTTFMSGYTEGFEVSYHFLQNFQTRWFSSFGRALAVGEFIRDWYAPITTTTTNGKPINLGIHAFEVSYEDPHVLFEPLVYFSPNTYITPGFKFHYNSNPNFKGIGFKSLSQIVLIVPTYMPHLYNTYYRGSPLGAWGVSLYFQQRFDYNQFNFGGGYFQNIGNANAKINRYGSPIGIDYRDNSVYGGLIDNMISPNAITGFIFGGGVHKKFYWGVLGKLTFAPRASEQTASLNLGIRWNEYVTSDLRLVYHEVSTHRGYKVGYNGPYDPNNPDFAPNTQDRSFLMTSLKAKF
ncbi:outer membrane family protein [Helicobacter salomonis]|uniref:OMP1326 n=1 Tax=Helicobacter salomonis TaxID=56878 RepID=A0A1M4NIJ6_9HELI|nr:outer membrane family protein [Helicobacter salomonis]SFZ73134.1 OMP1326 [Helicobacter salomonis]